MGEGPDLNEVKELGWGLNFTTLSENTSSESITKFDNYLNIHRIIACFLLDIR
jgi:hypothetical protein